MLSYPDFSRAHAQSKDGPHRVYGVLGDAYLQQEVVQALLGWSLDADARDFNLDHLDGEDASVVDVLSRCGNVPFLSERRVVIVSRVEKLDNIGKAADKAAAAESANDEAASASGAKSTGAKSKSKAKGASPSARLSEGLSTLPPSTVLILCRTPETPEPGARATTARCINAALDKVIEKSGVIIDCTLSGKQTGLCAAVLQKQAMQQDIPLADSAAGYLVQRAGTDLARLLCELEKCALRAGLGQTVTTQIIDEMVRRAPQDTIFDLTDALGERRVPRAIGLLRELLENGEAPELILSMLVRHLRQLLQARAILDAKLPLDASTAKRLPASLAAQLPHDNIANLLAVQSWRGRGLSNQARQFTTAQLEAALQGALDVDLAMKGIEGEGGTPELLLELLLARMN